jgi:hypothetical protein
MCIEAVTPVMLLALHHQADSEAARQHGVSALTAIAVLLALPQHQPTVQYAAAPSDYCCCRQNTLLISGFDVAMHACTD